MRVNDVVGKLFSVLSEVDDFIPFFGDSHIHSFQVTLVG